MAGVVPELMARVLASGSKKGLNVVAFSGGIDSSLVAYLVHRTFPSNSRACIGVSSSLPATQLDLARDVAHHIGIPLREVLTTEGDDPEYIANRGASCFHCKSHLYTALRTVADAEAHNSDPNLKHVLFNGTNADDKQDSTRVGLIAAANFSVASPVDSLTKNQVRQMAREIGLPNWDVAASPCLRSRLAFGVEATSTRLRMVEESEQMLRGALPLATSSNLRVRLLAMSGSAAVEVDEPLLEITTVVVAQLRDRLGGMGLQDVTVRKFKSGAVAAKVRQRIKEIDTQMAR